MHIRIDPTFTKEQKTIINEAIQKTNEVLEISFTSGTLDSYRERLKYLEFNNNGRLKTTAGNARTSLVKKEGLISVNKRLFNTTAGIEEFKNTVLHELAHVVANFLYSTNCGHNAKWKTLFMNIGGNGKQYHNYEVNHLRPKRIRHTANCGCQVFKITTAQKNKILRYNSLSCRSCGEKLKLSVEA